MAIIALSSGILLAGSASFDVVSVLATQFGHPIIGRTLSIVVVSSLALAAFFARRWQYATAALRAQRRMEGQLLESERRFAAFFSQIPNALFVANAGSGVIVDVNERMEQLLGMPRPHLIGRQMHDIGLCASPEEAARLRGTVREQGRVCNVETVVNTVAGTTRAVLLSAELVDDGQGKVVLGAFTEMSERCAHDDEREQRAFCSTLEALMNGSPRPDRRRAPRFHEARPSRYIHSG
jgi:PAS domain S-box-containing protein